MAKVIMVQGTMSNAGKSLVVAALCRIFKQDGYRVCPFKSQNMALNSYITKEGLEMGRAQVMQAEAAGIEPSTKMNPILLKPNSDTGSQVIVNGEVRGNMSAKEYYRKKGQYVKDILESYRALEEEYDIIVIEGAGSPAEINLQENDIVNMGMAKMVDSPVLLVGDIDRGGIFAQIYGTVMLLEKEEKERVKGIIINKFRGDKAILNPGLEKMEELIHIPVTGVIPYVKLDIDDEDSLSERLRNSDSIAAIDIVVIRFPRLSNFTDFAVFEEMENVSLRYVSRVEQLKNPDMIVLPGTKSTIADLLWMRQNGIEASIQKQAKQGTVIFGICGGFQMLGKSLEDPYGVESATGETFQGINLLPIRTVFRKDKHRTQITGTFEKIEGVLSGLNGTKFKGYEIHHGIAEYQESAETIMTLSNGESDGAQNGENVYGCYIHGIFDEKEVAQGILSTLLEKKGLDPLLVHVQERDEYKNEQYNKLAETVRNNIDMKSVYQILNKQI